jgi:hypothetical protein
MLFLNMWWRILLIIVSSILLQGIGGWCAYRQYDFFGALAEEIVAFYTVCGIIVLLLHNA